MLAQSEFYGTDNTIGASILSIETKNEPDFSTTATTDEGMFATIDINGGTTYYYRGAVADNWVYFAGFYWRIISFDEDGNVKMIYAGDEIITDDNGVTSTSRPTLTSAFNKSSVYLSDGNALAYSPEGVGYVYSDGELHGTDEDSTIKIQVYLVLMQMIFYI